MHIRVVLYGVFRDKLPPENRGRTTVELPKGSTISNLLERLDFRITAICSLNGQIEHDLSTILDDGDEVNVFRPVGGGEMIIIQLGGHGR